MGASRHLAQARKFRKLLKRKELLIFGGLLVVFFVLRHVFKYDIPDGYFVTAEHSALFCEVVSMALGEPEV